MHPPIQHIKDASASSCKERLLASQHATVTRQAKNMDHEKMMLPNRIPCLRFSTVRPMGHLVLAWAATGWRPEEGCEAAGG